MGKINFVIEDTDNYQQHQRRGQILTPHGVIHTPAVLPLTNRGMVNPLDNQELMDSGCQGMAVTLLPLFVQPGEETIQSVGGLGKFLNWSLPLISLVDEFPPMSKVKKNAGQLGVRYVEPYTKAQKRLTRLMAHQLQEIGQADIQLPLYQSADYYAPVNDLTTALQLNLIWQAQSKSAFGVVTGAGLHQLRQQSIQHLQKQQGVLISELPADDQEEWQRIVKETVQMLTPSQLRIVIAQNGDEIHDALQAGIDLILTADPIERAHRGEVYQESGLIKLGYEQYADDQQTLKINDHLSVTYAYLHYLIHQQSDLTDHLLGLYNWTWLNRQVAHFRQQIG